jgi:hypothetical protein
MPLKLDYCLSVRNVFLGIALTISHVRGRLFIYAGRSLPDVLRGRCVLGTDGGGGGGGGIPGSICRERGVKAAHESLL